MRYLPISLAFLLVSCGSYPKMNDFQELGKSIEYINNPYFSDKAKDYVYRAKIEAFDKSFGGIFIVKKLGQDHHRIVFTTEMGNKVFDFTLKGQSFRANYILPEMNKKVLIDILKKDFKVLVREKSIVHNGFTKDSNTIWEVVLNKENHLYFIKSQQLTKIIKVNGRKKKVEFIFSEINDNIVAQIQILHHKIPLRINLIAI